MVCRQVVLDVYLARHSMSVICDQLIAAAFHEIGDLWDCGDVEVYEERRACEISVRLIHELRQVVPQPQASAPTAFGGTIDGDPYTLAVSMAELVLRDAGWNASSLGHMLPFATIRTALEKHRPRLLWLSISAIRDTDRFVDEINGLFAVAQSSGTALALGGRSMSPELRQQLRYSVFCDTFQNLADFSRTLYASAPVVPKTTPPAT
jgi:methanogenic corrinoid protein MtbC1